VNARSIESTACTAERRLSRHRADSGSGRLIAPVIARICRSFSMITSGVAL
jgi:hypothetical protein